MMFVFAEHAFWRVLFFLVFTCMGFLQLEAQQKVSGTIRGTDNQPIIGATIVVKGTNRSGISNKDGSFSIEATAGDLLMISSVGMMEKNVAVGQGNFINIIMTISVGSIDEVMLIGYGTTRKKDLTGSATRFNIKEFTTGIITNPMQQVQGKVAGLVVTQPGGDPNGEFTVRIRGATSLEGQPPLLVIDGIAIDDFNKALATLNPADIESYDILKDASASAIYGSRGANGVILVTTKRARSGKTVVEYNGFVGLEKVSGNLDLLSAAQWREATASSGGGGLDKGADVDWQKETTREAVSTSHTLGISGGNDQFNVHGSVGYLKQDGVVKFTGREMISARLLASQKAMMNKLEIQYGINTSSIKRDLLPDQTTTSQSRTGGSSFFNLVDSYLPVWPVYQSDGSYNQVPGNLNPLFTLDKVYSKREENFYQASAKLDYKIIRGLKAGVLGALTKANDVYDYFVPIVPGYINQSSATKQNYNKQNFTGDIHADYQQQVNKHRFGFTGVYEYNKFVNDGFGVNARGFLVPELLNNNLGTATDIQTSDIFSFKNEVKLISFLGRFTYNFDDRYLFTANFRRDGSSKFGENNRWGNFPSFAIAWRASNENFMRNIKWISDLKLRVSYGFTGNQENIPPYAYQQLYGPAGAYFYNGQVYQSYAITQENNPDLKWEVRKSFNIGLDFSIFDNRIGGTIDYFNDETEDMLFQYDLPQPPFITNKVTANAANAYNKGFEITVNAAIVRNINFNWSVQANLGVLKNSITNLSGQFKGVDLSITNRYYGYAQGRGFSGFYVSMLQVGYPAGVLWLPEHAGLDASGHELYNNYDSAGKLIGTSNNYTDQDRVFIDPTPDYSWGITNTFRYKNADFSFFLRGVQGQKIFANSLLVLETTTRLPSSNVTEKALTNGFTEQPQPSTYWVRDASFMRLDNLSFGYNIRNLKGVSSLRFYLTASNLFVITKYEGIDPEIKTEGSQRYIDDSYYPKTRGFSVGVNAVF